jgi:hypothetical protein
VEATVEKAEVSSFCVRCGRACSRRWLCGEAFLWRWSCAMAALVMVNQEGAGFSTGTCNWDVAEKGQKGLCGINGAEWGRDGDTVWRRCSDDKTCRLSLPRKPRYHYAGCADDTAGPPLATPPSCCVWCANKEPCVVGISSGRRTWYWATHDRIYL